MTTSDLRYLVCSKCGTLNRVPANRFDGNAKCGDCKESLPMAKTVFDTKGLHFKSIIESSPLPVLVDFWAPWCGPCLGFAPVFEGFSKKHANAAVYLKVNTEVEQAVAGSAGIRAIPTLILYKDGQERARMSGALGAPQLAQWLSSNGVVL